MRSEMLPVLICSAVAIIMQSVAENENQLMNDLKRSPELRERSRTKYRVAVFFKNAMPILGILYIIMYILSQIFT